MSAYLNEVADILKETRADLAADNDRAKEKELRERMQVLEAWRVDAANGFIRETVEALMALYQEQVNDIQWQRKFPGPRPATDADEPDYWREKGRELRAEGEGLSRPYHEDENFGDEAGIR